MTQPKELARLGKQSRRYTFFLVAMPLRGISILSVCFSLVALIAGHAAAAAMGPLKVSSARRE